MESATHEAGPGISPLPTLISPVRVDADESLSGIHLLCDEAWVWETYCAHFGAPAEIPQRVRATQFRYRPGTRVLVSYVAEWDRGQWIQEEQFTVELAAGESPRAFRFPDDPYLPGLKDAAIASEAIGLLAAHAAMSPRVVLVETVRYRPGTRAVLRHVARWRRARKNEVTLFARVMRPERISRFMAAAEIAAQSGFALPRIAGCWEDGGVVWLASVPGATLRHHIRAGAAPEPSQVLDGLEPLWSAPASSLSSKGLDVRAGFRTTMRLLSSALDDEVLQRMSPVAKALDGFADSWRPTALALNDFYDDQLLLTPEGRLALVDFEAAGPGDPMFDVGNMLAHLRWMAGFGMDPEACDDYRRRLRAAALARFSWQGDDLNLREAFAIFRMSSNPLRQAVSGWQSSVDTALGMAAEALDGTD